VRKATLALLAVLILAPSAGGQSASDWPGTWETSFGTMKIRSDGTGVYSLCDGTLHGTFSGAVFSGTWTQTPGCAGASEGSGPFRFTLTTPTHFDGEWAYGSRPDNVRHNWSGDKKPPATRRWSYRGYANDVKVVPPLVADYQLGESHSDGSGSGATGSVRTRFTEKYAKYGGPYFFTAKVTGFSYRASAHGRTQKMVLKVTITDTNARRCHVGDTGTLTLRDSTKKLHNGQPADRAAYAWDGGQCPGFVQGWSNADGGAKTRPHRGGPPDGGQWAIVKID
jgi:hypothetical protein